MNYQNNSTYGYRLSPHKTSQQYALWIDQLLTSFTDPERIEWQPTENYLQWNALFVTFTFDKRKICRRQSALNDSSGTIGWNDGNNIDLYNKDDLSAEFFNIDRLYKKVCRAVLGRDYSKHRQEQPLLIAAADVNGTRYWKSAGEIQNLHIHSIWVFKKGQIEKARDKLEQVKASERENEFDFHEVDIANVGRFEEQGHPSALSSYSAKFLGFNAINPRIGLDLAIYPTHRMPESNAIAAQL